MATIVHRRPARPLGPEAPHGPGGSFDPLTWVGYASLVAAFGHLVFGLRPILDLGEPGLWDWTKIADIVTGSLRNVAVVGLPAALEWGVPGARRLTPWLMRGTVLLALEQVLQIPVRAIQSWYFESQSASDSFTYATPLGVAVILVMIAVTIIGLAGAWSLSDGLADAGGRPRRRLLVPFVVLGTALVALVYLPMLAIPSDPGADADMVLFWANIAGIVLSFLENAIWLMVGLRLLAGLASGLRPRLAWMLGALAGAAVLMVRIFGPVLTIWGQAGQGIGIAFRILSLASWVLLVLAFAAGLGRDRQRRQPRPRRLHLFVLNPTE